MPDKQQQRAQRIIEKFKSRLDPEAQKNIKDADLDELKRLIGAAMDNESECARDDSENVVKNSHKETDDPNKKV